MANTLSKLADLLGFNLFIEKNPPTNFVVSRGGKVTVA